MSKVIYIASFKYGEPELIKVEVIKETSKQFQVDKKSAVDIIGRQYVGNRVSKDGSVFDKEMPALQWLERQLITAIEDHKKSIQRTRMYLKNIRQRMEE